MKTVIINGIEMSYEQAHRMLWNWLADNPRCEKGDFFEQNRCNRDILHYCFACDLHKEYEEDGCYVQDCSKCPIKCGTEYDNWYKENRDFSQTRNIELISKLARQIANMKWRDNE